MDYQGGGSEEEGKRGCQLQAALSAGDWLLLLFYLVKKLFGGSVANAARQN